MHYNWSIPTAVEEPCIKGDNCFCVLRLRYNISTGDYEGRPTQPGMADATFNTDPVNAPGTQITDMMDASKVQPLVVQDPYVMTASQMLSLALNTDQYGRTFQDRSHIFELKPRPLHLQFGQRIFNLNVRGKRGNIVQTYPAVEYDFVPTNLVVRYLDYVHFQWTGFDDNPNNGNNNAEGTDGTDRSNLVQIASLNSNMPLKDDEASMKAMNVQPLFQFPSDAHRMAHLDQDSCEDYETLAQNNGNNQNAIDTDEKNCMKLNGADNYFDGGVIRMNTTGTFYYMSTRNNNFSNRSQKGSITVLPVLAPWAMAVTIAGSLLCLSSVLIGGMLIQAKRNPMSRSAMLFEKF
jgi:hypothetical protein